MMQRCYAASHVNAHAPGAWTCFTDDERGTLRDGEIVFFTDPAVVPTADWMFVIDSPHDGCVTFIPRERRILFLGEPPMIRVYDSDYLAQFGTVVSPYPIPTYKGNLLLGNPCLGWFGGYGIGGPSPSINRFRTLSDVRNYAFPEKRKKASIISSLKKSRAGHQQRLLFLDALMRRFGSGIDYYGREFSPVGDKLDAVAPYRYHIAIENSSVENSWTEKLADAWIGWSLPIYFGDPAIREKIPDPMGIETVDIRDIPAALDRIEEILRDDPFASRIDAVRVCREWVIREANPFERAARIIESAAPETASIPKLEKPVKIAPPAKRKRSARTIAAEALSSLKGRIIAARIRKNYTALRNAP